MRTSTQKYIVRESVLHVLCNFLRHVGGCRSARRHSICASVSSLLYCMCLDVNENDEKMVYFHCNLWCAIVAGFVLMRMCYFIFIYRPNVCSTVLPFFSNIASIPEFLVSIPNNPFEITVTCTTSTYIHLCLQS